LPDKFQTVLSPPGHLPLEWRRRIRPVLGCLCGLPPETFQNLVDENFSNFQVWNHKLIDLVFRLPFLGQVSCGKQYTSEIAGIFVQIAIGQFRMNFLPDSFAVHQLFKFTFCSLICFSDYASDDVVAAGVNPVRQTEDLDCISTPGPTGFVSIGSSHHNICTVELYSGEHYTRVDQDNDLLPIMLPKESG